MAARPCEADRSEPGSGSGPLDERRLPKQDGEVIRKLAKPWWVQAHLVVRKGKTRIVETHFPAVVRESPTTYLFEICQSTSTIPPWNWPNAG